MFLNGLEKSEGHAGAILQAKNIVDIAWLITDRYMKNSFEENMTKYHLYILSIIDSLCTSWFKWVYLGRIPGSQFLCCRDFALTN